MGLFQDLFGKHKETAASDTGVIGAPADGTIVPLEEFPDEVFSQGVLGPGCGILPSGSVVCAPFAGTVTQCTDTQHAIGVTSAGGVEVLIHIGVDTVDMQGKGFRCLVTPGKKLRPGEALIEFDREVIKAAGHSDTIAVVITNADEFASVERIASGEVIAGGPLLKAKAAPA